MSPEGDEVTLCQRHVKAQSLCLQERQVDVKEEVKEELCDDFEFGIPEEMNI